VKEGTAPTAEQRAEIRELRAELEPVTRERDILGKAFMHGAVTAVACNRGGAACRRRDRLVLSRPWKSMTVGFVGDR
jgi:hypothetical protein